MTRKQGATAERRSGVEEIRERLVATIPATERRLELAGVSTAVLEGGDGPPLVILHGIGQFAATWARVVPELVGTHRVILPDLPGQGASEVVEGQLDAGRVLDWLGELIARTCPSPPVLVGHHGGGAIAARFAAGERGREITKLVLVDSFGLGPFRPAPRFALAMVGFMVHPTEHTRDRMLGQCMVDFTGVREEMDGWDLIAAYALEGARTPSMKAAGRRLMKEFGVPVIPEAELRRIDVPTSLIWGRHDPETRLRIGEAASQRYGWPLHVLERCGADPNVEQPEALVEALRVTLTR